MPEVTARELLLKGNNRLDSPDHPAIEWDEEPDHWPAPDESREESVTVCIAALCRFGGLSGIIGVSDRLLTSGNTQYELPVRKTYPVTDEITVMIAGDVRLQSQILLDVKRIVEAKKTEDPNFRWFVEDIVDAWNGFYGEARKVAAERDILRPIGMDYSSYWDNQLKMPAYLAQDIHRKLQEYDFHNVSALFSGVDPEGAKIYVSHNGRSAFANATGFEAIGTGAFHANTLLRLTPYSQFLQCEEALMHVISAKKRAEVTPGVGPATDVFLIGPSPGEVVNLDEKTVADLERIYEKSRREERKITARAVESCKKYLYKLVAPLDTQPQELPPSESLTPVFGEEEAIDKEEGN